MAIAARTIKEERELSDLGGVLRADDGDRDSGAALSAGGDAGVADAGEAGGAGGLCGAR